MLALFKLIPVTLTAAGIAGFILSIGMAVDAIKLAPTLDVIILATGDGDFMPLIEYLQIGMGKIVEVVAFARTTSNKIKEEVSRFTDVDSIPKVIFKSERSRRANKPTMQNKNKWQAYSEIRPNYVFVT